MDEDVPRPVRIDSYEACRSLKFTSVDLLDTRTTLPFALQCKFNEALLMEKAMQLFECIPQATPLTTRVDGVYFAANTQEDICEFVPLARIHRYPISDRLVYAIKDAPTCLPVNAQSWAYKTIPTPAIGKWLHAHDHTFDGIDDGVSYEGKITRTVLENEGGLITGPAGAEKSVLLKQIRQAIKDRGGTVFTCA